MSLSTRFETIFGDLVSAWTRHNTLRAAGASPAELFTSRRHLDEARRAMAVARAQDHHHLL